MSAARAACTVPSRTPFRELLDRLPVGAYTCDTEGLITYYNEHAVRLWGRAPKLNDPVDRYCGSFKLYAPDGTPISHDKCWMALALQTGQEWNGHEIVIERPDGERVSALAHASPFRDESGQIMGAINALVDITDRQRAADTQLLLATIVEASDDAIVSKDLDGRILSWNSGAARLFGFTPQEAIGQSIKLIIPPERHGEEDEILGRLRRGERIEHYETVRVAKGGRRLEISVTISPIRDGSGRIIAASKVARDITARKQAEHALREAARQKDLFLATLAHELRNPLAPIRNSVEALRLTGQLRGDAEEIRQILERQVKHLVRLVDDLLEVSRMTRGKVELRKEPVELAELVRSAIEVSRESIEARGHQLTVSIPSEPIVLDADPVRVAEVVADLLENAAKFTPEGGRISITATQEGEQVGVSIRDTGVGISAEMLPKVFDMFSQADPARGQAKGGLGVGLALAKGIVELHQGRLDAFSEGPGRGSRFVMHLPVVRQAAARAVSIDAGRRPQLPAHRILVVDDARAAGYLLSKLLEAIGQQVVVTNDPKSAVGLVRQTHPDVVISDIGMPEMDGYELARQLRRIAGPSELILVALTGYGQDQDRERARNAGFDHHLVKPVSLESLEELLAGLPLPGYRIDADDPHVSVPAAGTCS